MEEGDVKIQGPRADGHCLDRKFPHPQALPSCMETPVLKAWSPAGSALGKCLDGFLLECGT